MRARWEGWCTQRRSSTRWPCGAACAARRRAIGLIRPARDHGGLAHAHVHAHASQVQQLLLVRVVALEARARAHPPHHCRCAVFPPGVRQEVRECFDSYHLNAPAALDQTHMTKLLTDLNDGPEHTHPL